MFLRTTRRGAALISAAVLAAVLTPTAASAAPGPAAESPVRNVVLPTGEHVHIADRGGRIVVQHEPGDPQVVVHRIGTHVYALPVDYLATPGHSLDLARFDVTRLAGDLPASTGAQLHYPQVTVTLRIVLPDNPAPDQVAATIVNTDNARRYAQTLGVSGGVQRLSLPRGNYSVLVFSAARDSATHTQVLRMAFAVDQHIESAGQVIRVNLAAATQNGFATYRAPATATTVDQGAFYAVEDDQGRDLAGSWEIFGGNRVQLLVASTEGGAHGRLISVDNTVQRATAPSRPLYYLTWGHRNAVVGDEHVDVPANRLSTIETHYYTDGATHDGISSRTPTYPYFDPGVATFQDAPMPGVRDEYVFSPAGVVWFNDMEALADTGGFADMSGFGRYAPGVDYREDIWRGPLAPGVITLPPGAHTHPTGGPRACSACRTATGMSVGLSAFVGSQPDYGGGLVAWPGQRPHETHLTVYRDGNTVFEGYNAAGGVVDGAAATFDTPPDEHSYRILETANRAVDGMSLSTTATTDYRFASSATSGPRLGAGWDCVAPGPKPCTVLPLLAVRVPLPTSLTGTLPSGYSFLIVDVGHVQGATPTPVTGFRLAVGTGGTYVPQSVVDLGGGRYYVAIDNRAAPGTAVDVRWHATDADGAAITQTVHSAYTIEGS